MLSRSPGDDHLAIVMLPWLLGAVAAGTGM